MTVCSSVFEDAARAAVMASSLLNERRRPRARPSVAIPRSRAPSGGSSRTSSVVSVQATIANDADSALGDQIVERAPCGGTLAKVGARDLESGDLDHLMAPRAKWL